MKDGGHGDGGGERAMCYFHPREVVVGVCSQCLRERLLLLLSDADDADRPLRRKSKTSSISLPKVFALGSFLQRLDSSRHHHLRPGPHDSDADTASIPSLDDSFISIKFEDNGKATWDSQKAAAGEKKTDTTTAVVEHVKRGGVTRWRKLLQLARWKRSGNGKAACQLGLDGKKTTERSSKGRGRSWIRTLTITRRRPAMPLS
uniref:Uncharacterized protein n=1 Tax=Oryza punctata TaxID=4537 RepID=A0A0E0KX74_ORYPU